MAELDTTNKFENAVMAENLSRALSNDEREKIENTLRSNNIDIIFRETGPKASLFDAIAILFNEPLTKMIINGLLASGAYDAIKSVVLCFLEKLKNAYKVRSDGNGNIIKKDIPHLDLRLKTDNAELNVLISRNFTHKQVLEYMDKARETMIELGKTQIPKLQKYEIYIIDSDSNKPESIKVMTMSQYGKEQLEKQEKENAEI